MQTEGQDIYLLNHWAVPRRNATPGKNNVELLLNGKRLVEPYDYLLRIKVGHGDFVAANSREGIFDCNKNSCRSNIGRFSPSKAKPVRGGGWEGHKVEISCSSEDSKTGFHAAGGVCLWVVGSDGQRNFVLNTLGEAANVRLARKVIKSLRLMKDPRSTNESHKPVAKPFHTGRREKPWITHSANVS